MVEQAKELTVFHWPEKYDARREVSFDLGPCILIAKPIRLPTPEKPGRDLSVLAPRSEVLQRIFSLRDVYKERVYPGGLAGFHFHERKIEIIYPLTHLNLFFFNLRTQELPIGIEVPERIGDTTFGFLVKDHVAHAIQNPSKNEYRFYQVLTNRLEEEALRDGDVNHYKFDLPPTQSLQSLLKSGRLLK